MIAVAKSFCFDRFPRDSPALFERMYRVVVTGYPRPLTGIFDFVQRGVLFTLFYVTLASTASGTDTLVLGRAVSNSYVGHSIHHCEPGEICRESLYRWIIDAKRTLAGPSVSGHTEAVIDQETAATQAFVDSTRLFLLRPASDLPFLPHFSNARYYLVSLSPLYEDGNYCLSVNPMENEPRSQAARITGIRVDSDGDYCFPAAQFK